MGCCNGPRESPDFCADREGPSDDDLARFGGDDVPCPTCGEEMYVDASVCPACGYIVGDTRAIPSPLRRWGGVIAGVTAAVLVFWLIY